MNSRWIDLAETSGEAIAHDNQSLDSGAEGPEEPGRPENHLPSSGKSLTELAVEFHRLKTPVKTPAFH